MSSFSLFFVLFALASCSTIKPSLNIRGPLSTCGLSDEGLNVGCVFERMRFLWHQKPSNNMHLITCSGIEILGCAKRQEEKVVASLFHEPGATKALTSLLTGAEATMSLSDDGFTETYTIKHLLAAPLPLKFQQSHKVCGLTRQGLNVGCIFECMVPLWNETPSGKKHMVTCPELPILGCAERQEDKVVASLKGSEVTMTLSDDGAWETLTFIVKTTPLVAKL